MARASPGPGAPPGASAPAGSPRRRTPAPGTGARRRRPGRPPAPPGGGQHGRGLRLPAQALAVHRVAGEGRVQRLDRHRAPGAQVGGPVDGAHAPPPEHLAQAVAAGEDRPRGAQHPPMVTTVGGAACRRCAAPIATTPMAYGRGVRRGAHSPGCPGYTAPRGSIARGERRGEDWHGTRTDPGERDVTAPPGRDGDGCEPGRRRRCGARRRGLRPAQGGAPPAPSASTPDRHRLPPGAHEQQREQVPERGGRPGRAPAVPQPDGGGRRRPGRRRLPGQVHRAAGRWHAAGAVQRLRHRLPRLLLHRRRGRPHRLHRAGQGRPQHVSAPGEGRDRHGLQAERADLRPAQLHLPRLVRAVQHQHAGPGRAAPAARRLGGSLLDLGRLPGLRPAG